MVEESAVVRPAVWAEVKVCNNASHILQASKARVAFATHARPCTLTNKKGNRREAEIHDAK